MKPHPAVAAVLLVCLTAPAPALAQRGHQRDIEPPPATPQPPLVSGPVSEPTPNPLIGPSVTYPALVPLPYPEAAAPRNGPVGGSGFVMTFEAGVSPPATRGAISAAQQVPARLAACWHPAAAAEVTVRLQFAKSGAIVGEPRITYVKPTSGQDASDLRKSIRAALASCTPLPFTPRFGSAIAGYPFAIRFIAVRW